MKKLWVLAVVMGCAASVRGAGFGIYEASARGMAMGGAIVGDVHDATAAYHNPANMAFSTNIQIAASVTFIKPYCDVEVDHVGQNRMDPGWFTVPTFYLTIPLSDDFVFGWGNYTEYGLGSKYGRDWDLAADTQRTTMEEITLNPSLAYKIMDRWSVAAGPRISWISFYNHKQPHHGESLHGSDTESGYGLYDYTIDDAFNLDSKLKGDSWAYGWMAATTFKPTDDLSLGLVYRSEIRHKIAGRFRLGGTAGGVPDVQVDETAVKRMLTDVYAKAYTGALGSMGLTPQTAPAQAQVAADSFAKGKVAETQTQLQQKLAAAKTTWQGEHLNVASGASAKLRLPDSLTFGANYDVTPRFRIGSSITYTRWSTVDKIRFCIPGGYSYTMPLKWRDTYRVGVGMEYDFLEWLSGRIGYTFDEDPTRQSCQSTMLPGGDRHIIGAGFGIELMENLRLDLAYSFIRMNNRHYWIHMTDYEGNAYQKRMSCRNGSSHLVAATITYSF